MKRYTVWQIYVTDRVGGNLSSAKTAQDLALLQLANKMSSFPEQEKQTDQSKNTTQCPQSPTTRESNPVQNNASTPRSEDRKIQEIIKNSTIFEGQKRTK